MAWRRPGNKLLSEPIMFSLLTHICVTQPQWVNPIRYAYDFVVLCYWPFVQGIRRWLVNSPHKGQWRGALMFSLICDWINAWVNNREAGDLRHYRAHYDVTVMISIQSDLFILMHQSCFICTGTIIWLSKWHLCNPERWGVNSACIYQLCVYLMGCFVSTHTFTRIVWNISRRNTNLFISTWNYL